MKFASSMFTWYPCDVSDAMGRTAPGQAEEMVKVLRLVMGGLQIPFIFFLMP